jgi:lipoprotein-releasing system permease protein
MWIESTLAVRFLKESRTQSLLILAGISIGVAVIVFLSALIAGLQANLIERTLGTQAHIKLEAPDEVNRVLPAPAGTTALVLETPRPQRRRSINNWQQVRDTLDAQPDVTAVSPLISGPAFARRGDALESVVLMGIDPARYLRIVPVDREMVAGQFRIGASDVVIGKDLAWDLGAQVGDTLRIDTGRDNETVVTIAGIFSLGVGELDSRYIYMDMRPAQALLGLPGGATVIDLRVDALFGADAIAARLGRLTGQKSESWMVSNAQLMNALSAQSQSTNMISFFVAVSVAFGIASVLSVSVVQRTGEIGILRAMGTTRQQMLRVFLIQGALYGLAGSLLGGALGYSMLWAFNRFGPGLFAVPLSPMLLLVASVLATVTGMLAAMVPARRAAAMDPVEAIRHG